MRKRKSCFFKLIISFAAVTFMSGIAVGEESKAAGDPIIKGDTAKSAVTKKKKSWGKSKWSGIRKKKTADIRDAEWNAMDTSNALQTARGNYMLFCSACHGEKGDGKGPVGETLETPPRNHTDATIMSTRTDEHLFKVISEGGSAMGFSADMPSHRTVMPEKDLRGLVKYLRKLCSCKYKE